MTDIVQTPPAAPPAPPAKRKRPPSRADRWNEAVSRLQSALGSISELVSEVEDAASELRSVQEEYESWKDNLPENLASSPLGEKLEEVCNLDIEGIGDNLRNAVDEAESTIGDAEGLDLPMGFGRD